MPVSTLVIAPELVIVVSALAVPPVELPTSVGVAIGLLNSRQCLVDLLVIVPELLMTTYAPATPPVALPPQ